MAEFVLRALREVPVDVHEDDSASRFGGECGNLICVPRSFDASRPAIALIAHLDTPRSTLDVKPVVTDARIASDGTTALGVDNRAGVSILLHVLQNHRWIGSRANALFVFTVGEETGPDGSQYLDLSPYGVKMCFVFDCSRRPGTYIQSAVGCSLFTAAFTGRSSHAGVSPEKGINAVHLAAIALSKVPTGRLNASMTTNIAMISGGTATNVVPDRCTVEGEVREFRPEPIGAHLRMLEETFRSTASEYGGGVEFTSREDFPPFRLSPENRAVRMTDEVLRAVGLTPNPIEYLGGSDANMLNAKGIPSINLGIGAQNPHGNDEFILIEDLHTSVKIAEELIRRSETLA